MRVEWKRQQMHESHNLSTNRIDVEKKPCIIYIYTECEEHIHMHGRVFGAVPTKPPYLRSFARGMWKCQPLYFMINTKRLRALSMWNFHLCAGVFELCRSCFLLHFILRRSLTPQLVNGLRNFVTLFLYVLWMFVQIVVFVVAVVVSDSNCCCCWSAACLEWAVRHCLIIYRSEASLISCLLIASRLPSSMCSHARLNRDILYVYNYIYKYNI